jgi:hypothetical protein
MRERPRPRITRDQIAEIRRLRRDGLKLREIAGRLGISINSACRHGKVLPVLHCRLGTLVRRPRPAVIDSYIAPPSRARLMAGR